MTELRIDFAGDLVDATVAASRDDPRHAPAVAGHTRLSRTAYGALAVALVHGVRAAARRPVEPAAAAAID
jgi:hypothetical protein